MSIEKALVIVNPAAGTAKGGDVADAIERELTARGAEVTLHLTTGAGDARRLAEKAVSEGRECVVAAGGDGTIGEVAAALAGTEVALGVVALGTGNAVGRELGLPLDDVPGACEVIAEGDVHMADVGVVNDVPFVIMCGVGLDAEVAHRTEGGNWKGRLGKWAFVGQFMWTLVTTRRRRFRVTVDGEVIEKDLWAAIACSAAQYSWRLSFASGARTDDGRLHVVLFEHRNRAQLFFDISRHWLSQGRTPAKHVTRLEGREVRIEVDPPARWQADGDARGMSPVEVRIQPRILRILVPPS